MHNVMKCSTLFNSQFWGILGLVCFQTVGGNFGNNSVCCFFIVPHPIYQSCIVYIQICLTVSLSRRCSVSPATLALPSRLGTIPPAAGRCSVGGTLDLYKLSN
jgi:hypothetical protein